MTVTDATPVLLIDFDELDVGDVVFSELDGWRTVVRVIRHGDIVTLDLGDDHYLVRTITDQALVAATKGGAA